MGDQEAYQKAKERVENKIGFFTHLAAFVIINLVLIGINLVTTSDYYWFIWPLIGWSVGLLFHGIAVFVFMGDSSLKERMIEKEMRKVS
jgi:hypothetical protein